MVTSGPTIEPIDPVRYLGNRSSGRQGHAIATALRDAGAEVILVTGPVALPNPEGVTTQPVQTAREMLAACEAVLPVDVAVCAAAVADWRPARMATRKTKKIPGGGEVTLRLVENPDILRRLSRRRINRPRLVIGFAAETEQVVKNAVDKRMRKGCDWIIANDVSGGRGFDQDDNEVACITKTSVTWWPRMSKRAISERLVTQIQHSME